MRKNLLPRHFVAPHRDRYLDAWCHLRQDLRSFSVDAMTQVHVLDTQAKEIAAKRIDEVLSVSYGIFGGGPKAWAVLQFMPERARWVRGEQWHPLQESRDEPDGSYVLSVPYSDEREILGDILKFGADVVVVAPVDLKRKVHQAGLALAGRYV